MLINFLLPYSFPTEKEMIRRFFMIAKGACQSPFQPVFSRTIAYHKPPMHGCKVDHGKVEKGPQRYRKRKSLFHQAVDDEWKFLKNWRENIDEEIEIKRNSAVRVAELKMDISKIKNTNKTTKWKERKSKVMVTIHELLQYITLWGSSIVPFI